MGCCFSKELNPGLQSERSSLLQSPLHDGLSEVTDQVRQHAAAVAQHVCLDEEETHVADGPAQRKPPEDEERYPGPDDKVWTEAAVVNGDGTTRTDGDLKPASTHEEKGAILITASTNIHTNTDTETGMTHTARPSCGPAPYKEVPTQSPAKQKILENATLRALWFNQLPDGQNHKPEKCWSAPARLPSSHVTESKVSDDQPPPPLVSECQETQRGSPEAELKEEEGEEVDTTTLCQGSEKKTLSFYSLCSIDADDLEHDHGQSQTAGATHSLHTAEAETAALPCIVESPVSSQSHTEASTARDTESKMTVQSHDEEPASATEQSDSSLSAEQTTSPRPVVSPQLVDPPRDPLTPDGKQIHGEEPDRTQPGDLTSASHESKDDAVMTPHADESACVEQEDELVEGSEESVRGAEAVFSPTEDTVAEFQEGELDQSVDSDFNPLDDHLQESGPLTEQHIQSSQPAAETPELDTPSPPTPDLTLKPLHEEEVVFDKPSLQNESVPVSICRGPSEEGDVGHSGTADTTLTEVSSVSTVSAASSLPTELTAFSCPTNLTPLSDFQTSHQRDSITSDKLDVNSNDPTFELSSIKPPCQDAEAVLTASEHRCDECDQELDVKTEGAAVSDEPLQDVLMSGDDRRDVKTTTSETCQSSQHVERGDVTDVTARNTSHLETSDDKCDLLSEHCDDRTAVNTSITPQDPEDPDSSTEDSTQPPPAETELSVTTSSSTPPSSSPPEEGEHSFCPETEADSTESECRQIQLKLNPPGEVFSHVCEEGEETTGAQVIDLPIKPESADAAEQTASEPPESLTCSVSSDCTSPKVHIGLQHDTPDCLPHPAGSSHGVHPDLQEETSALDIDIPPETLNISATETPSQSFEVPPDSSTCKDTYEVPNDGCLDDKASVLDHQEDHAVISVDPGQIDVYASTPSYEIHFLGHEPAATAEEGEREGGMREMVSELLGEDADSSVCRLYPQPWIKLGLEGTCGGWAQGASDAEPSQGESKTGGDAEQIPALVSELQPSMALLGAYPYSTVMPQGPCVWDWHTDCTQSVSVHMGDSWFSLMSYSQIKLCFYVRERETWTLNRSAPNIHYWN